MILNKHPLVPPSPGTARELVSLHYGPTGTGRKAAIQASLHADEVPALLVAHHLRRQLAALCRLDLAAVALKDRKSNATTHHRERRRTS